MTPDIMNGILEMSGSLFLSLCVWKTWQDKAVKGVSWVAVSFFTGWAYWNLYYYPNLEQWWSLWGSMAMAVVQTIWLGQLIYYSRKAKIPPTFIGRRAP